MDYTTLITSFPVAFAAIKLIRLIASGSHTTNSTFHVFGRQIKVVIWVRSKRGFTFRISGRKIPKTTKQTEND